MANQLAILFNHITGIFDAMPLVNTIVLKDDDIIDVEKENIYPLVSLRLVTSPRPDQNARGYRFDIAVLNQRDDTKKPTPSKLLTDTNYVDNMAVCDSIANNFVMEILKSHNVNDIWIDENSITDFQPVETKDERNCLDGIRFSCTFTMHQNAV